MKRLILVIITSGVLWNGMATQAYSLADSTVPQHLTLEDAIKLAWQNHPQVLSADLNTKASAENVNVARSAYLPQVTGNAVSAFDASGTRIAAPGGLTNPTVFDRSSAGIGVSQLITDFGKTSDLIASSKLELEAQKQHANLTRETVLLDVTRAYYNVLRAKSLLRVAEDTLKTRSKLLEQVSSLREAKIKSDLDVSIARQGVADANLLLLRATTGVDDAQATLSEALGINEPATFELADNSNVLPPPITVEPLIATALDHNPELAALKAERDAQKKAAEAANEEEYPTVSALGYAGGTPIREDDQNINSHYAAAGITISIPFYTGGRIAAQEKGSEYKAFAAEQDLILRKNQLLRDIRIAFDNTRTAYKNIDVSKQLLKSTRESLELTQARYDLGKSSIVDLSEAQLTETQAEIAEANANYEYFIQRAVLDYRIGNNTPIAPEM